MGDASTVQRQMSTGKKVILGLSLLTLFSLLPRVLFDYLQGNVIPRTAIWKWVELLIYFVLFAIGGEIWLRKTRQGQEINSLFIHDKRRDSLVTTIAFVILMLIGSCIAFVESVLLRFLILIGAISIFRVIVSIFGTQSLRKKL